MARAGENKVTSKWFSHPKERTLSVSEEIFLQFWKLYMLRQGDWGGGLWCHKIENFLEYRCFQAPTLQASLFATKVFVWLGTISGMGFLTGHLLKEIKNISGDSYDSYAHQNNNILAIMRWAEQNARDIGTNGGRRTLEGIKGSSLSAQDFEIAEGVMRFVVSETGRTLVTKILHEINKTPYGGWGITWETPVEPEQFDTWLANED